MSFLRRLAAASNPPRIPNPNPANPVLVSVVPVLAKRLVSFLISSDVTLPDVTLAGVITGTSTAGLPGSVILAVPGTLPSGNSLFGTFPLPFSPIVTVIGFPSLPGISTLVPGLYVDPSGFFGVTIAFPFGC